MKNQELESLVKVLKEAIIESDKKFEQGVESYAQIIGFLQGSISGVVKHIEENHLDKNKNA
jgi:hypothetical protein